MRVIKTIISVVTCIFLSHTTFSQVDVDSIFQGKKEIYFRFENKTGHIDTQLSSIISIDHKTSKNWVYAYANKKMFSKFLSLNISYQLLPHPGTLIQPLMKDKIELSGTKDWDFYPTYEAYVDLMYQFEQAYPGLCDVFSIGTSIDGRQLLVAKISNNVNMQESKARFLYTSSIHGDETTGYILMLHLIDYLLSNYGTDQKVTTLVDNLEIWINPLANPDGTYAGGNSTIYGATRFNANGIDLNRNYPDPDDGQHPDGNEWQKETQEFMAMADSVSFVMSANFHGGSEVFNYPWDTWSQLNADDDWWQYVGREWADTVHAYSPAGYFNEFNDGITNGYAWYTITGGRQDYMNYFHHCREVTVELSYTKLLPASEFPNYWEYNYRSFLNYMEQALFGITGIVTDSASGNPLEATITIENHDNNNSWISTNATSGAYFRPIYEGNWDVTFFASGHEAKTFQNILTLNRKTTELDVSLVYNGSSIQENTGFELFHLVAEQKTNEYMLTYSGKDAIKCTVQLIRLNGACINSTEYDFNPYLNRFPIHSIDLSKGIYLVQVSAFERNYVFKLIVM